MTKTTKTTLWVIAFLVIGVANLILLIPIALFALFCMGDFSLDGYDPPLSFTQKEVEAIGKERCHLSGMTFPEDMTYMNGEYDSPHGRYGVWFYEGAWNYISTEPFKLPEKVDNYTLWTENLDITENNFSKYFNTVIRGGTSYSSGTWITNGFVFDATILKTHEKYYLRLYSYDIETRHLERHLRCAETPEEVRAAQEMMKTFAKGNLEATCEAAYSIADIVWWKHPIAVDFSLEMLDEVDEILTEKEDMSLINMERKEPVTDYYRARIYYTMGEVEKGDEYAEKARPRLKKDSLGYLQYCRSYGCDIQKREKEQEHFQKYLPKENIEEQSKEE